MQRNGLDWPRPVKSCCEDWENSEIPAGYTRSVRYLGTKVGDTLAIAEQS
jgi:hypothetical protein